MGITARRRVLIVSADPAARRIYADVFLRERCTVDVAEGAAEAITLLETGGVHVVLVHFDQRDSAGLQLVECLRAHAHAAALLVVSEPRPAVLAGREPLAPQHLVLVTELWRLLHRVPANGDEPVADRMRAPALTPNSSTQRWAAAVMGACASDQDLKTIGQWAHFCGMSYSSLCEISRIVGIRPQRSRDLARALRAVVQAAQLQCAPEILLDFSDRRTLRSFLQLAGAGFAPDQDVHSFLQQQQFVPAQHQGVCQLALSLVSTRGHWRATQGP
jgi:CheY-like chemotaxis protein